MKCDKCGKNKKVEEKYSQNEQIGKHLNSRVDFIEEKENGRK